MLRFFRINDPYRLLGVLFVLLLASLPLFIDPVGITLPELLNHVLGEMVTDGKTIYLQIYDDTPPLAATFFAGMDFVFGRSALAWRIVAFLILFFQAAYFGIVLINNKAYEENTYLPALIYGVLAFLSFDLFSFSGELIASTFLLFTLNNLYKEIEFRVQRDETVLNIGLTIGLSSLVIFSTVVFLPTVIFLLAIFARLDIRKVVLLLFGFALPHGVLAILYFLWDGSTLLWQNFYLPNLLFTKDALISWTSLLIISGLPLAYFLFSVIMLNRVARFTRYQSQLLQVMFIWITPCIAFLLLNRQLTPHSLFVFLPILSYFITHYFLLIRRRWIAEIMLWFFIVGILCFSLMARYQKIPGVDYRALALPAVADTIANKRIMVLDHNPGIYKDNAVAGYFFNWNLSHETFEQLDYYENVITINNALTSDPPDIIMDKNNLMKSVMERIPALKKKYKKEGNNYVKISN